MKPELAGDEHTPTDQAIDLLNHGRMLLRNLDRAIANLREKLIDNKCIVEDRYGIVVRDMTTSRTHTTDYKEWFHAPLSLNSRHFGRICSKIPLQNVANVDLMSIALSLTDISDWAHTEAERRGQKIQKVMQEGVTPDNLRLLSLCGLQPGTGHTIISLELTTQDDRYLSVEYLRHFILAHAWEYRDIFPFMAYWPGGIVCIFPGIQEQMWTHRAVEWLRDWETYQEQLNIEHHLSLRASIGSFADLHQLDATLHDVQTTMKFAAKENTTGIISLKVDPFTQMLSNIPNKSIQDSVYQTLSVLLRPENHDLLRTLWIYLHSNQNATETAKQLFVHRNTLHYRIRQIEQMLHVRLNDTAQTSLLWFGLRALEFLELSGVHLLQKSGKSIFKD